MDTYLHYLQYNLTHEQVSSVSFDDLTHSQPDGYGNKLYFKFDTATGKLVSQREQFCFAHQLIGII